MNKLNTLALAAGLVFAGSTLAQASEAAPGSYQYTVGKSAPCVVTLAPDSQATAAEDCSKASTIAKWKNTAGGLQLLSNSGVLVAVFKENGSNYEGTRIYDGRKVVLSPNSQVGYK